MTHTPQSPDNGVDDFYIGYQPQAPARLKHPLRRTVGALFLLVVGLAATLVASQSSFANSKFEFLNYQIHEGTLHEWPYPLLISGGTHYLLVGPGKHGAGALVKGLDGQAVRLRGELIKRGENRMLEIEPGSLRQIAPGSTRAAEIPIGNFTLNGEIVDTKCHFGVMKPGEGKVHRDCAVRCISGGVPPGFLVRDADGLGRVVLLTGRDGRPLGREILDFVGEPIRIHGQLVRQGSLWLLKAEPKDFQRD
jgi:hypothetical protein